MYPQQIIDALRHVRYPGTGKDLIESGMLEDDIRISGFEVSFSLIFQKENDPFMKSVVKAAEVALQTYIDPNVTAHIQDMLVLTITLVCRKRDARNCVTNDTAVVSTPNII